MPAGTFVQKGEMMLKIAGPVSQVVMIVRIELGEPTFFWECSAVMQRGAPLVSWMRIHVDQSSAGKMAPEPGQAEIDTIKLKHRPSGSTLDEDLDVSLHVRFPETLVHVQVVVDPGLAVISSEDFKSLVLAPVCFGIAV